MDIIKSIPQGFCKGVIQAINKTNDALSNAKKPIYMFGSIVHNKNITNTYEHLGIKMIQSLDQVSSKTGSIIITAHGVSRKRYKEIASLGLDIIDTTCDSVRKIQLLIEEMMNNNYYCLYYGKKNHAECLGIEEDYSDNNHFILIQNLSDIEKISINDDKIFFTNQTTMSYFDTLEIIEKLKEKYPHAIIKEDICTATKMRQLAFIECAKKTDFSLVIGDKTSNNTLSLAAICNTIACKKCALIEELTDLDHIDLSSFNSISITSGASTPSIIVNEVIQKINHKNYISKISDLDYIKTTR